MWEAGIYKEQLEKMIANGNAYRCFLSPEDACHGPINENSGEPEHGQLGSCFTASWIQELDEMRAEAERNDQVWAVGAMSKCRRAWCWYL